MATESSDTTSARASAAPQPVPQPAPQSTPRRHRWDTVLYDIWHAILLILSLILIAWISYDTFNQLPFLSNHQYMTFQFWVCIVFLIDFVIGFFVSKKKGTYLKNRWFFLLISIPYLNIINQYDIHFPEAVLYYLRFIPLLRGIYALAMVVGYVSKNRAASMLSQYTSILIALIYCTSLIFYYQELPVNPNVKTFWDALYWSCMYVTTVGCSFSAVTVAGKIISVILPIAGMLILPMFTVYITDLVRKYHNFQSQF